MPDFDEIKGKLRIPDIPSTPKRDDETNRQWRKRHGKGKSYLRNWHWVNQKGICTYCRILMVTKLKTAEDKSKLLTLDHRDPLSNGGPMTLENTHAICFDCNCAKQDISHAEFSVNWQHYRDILYKSRLKKALKRSNIG